MKTYLKYLIYYSLSLLDSVLNFCSSIFGWYPKVEIAEGFLINIELVKAGRTISTRNQERMEKSLDAERTMDSTISMFEKEI